ncbi:phage tail protein [Yersinia enterocolitica]|uniref:phage tail protein n=1 Tax=Yersinia enterocolitica TaxID=630 RepID=UPI00398D1F3C
MTVKYFALLTNLGAAKLANAAALGTQLQITQMAVGDGGGALPTPSPAQTQLLSEKRRAALNSLSIDAANSSQIIAEQVIPETDGGWWIREVGLFDKDGILIAIANCPETYKPQLQEGSGRTQTMRMVLIVSSTEAVTLKIDPSVVLATRKFVDDKVIEVKQYAADLLTEHEKSRNHPDASKTEKGFVKLSNAITSDSEALAATPKAVKTVSDAALKIANNLSEIKNAGDKAVVEALLNLDLGDVAHIPFVQTMGARMISYLTVGTFPFTVPDGVTRIRARVVGGGGGAGGSAAAKSGGGGGGGGYAESWITVTPGQVLSITVGAGGAGGTAGNAGSSGSVSSVSEYLSASGGLFGEAGGGGTGAGGFGGTGTGGDVNSNGSDGSDGTTASTSGAGNGGGAVLGGSTRSGSAGRNSLSIGGGGAASYTLASQNGGNGHAGAVILEY